MTASALITPLETLRRSLPDTARDIKLNMAALVTTPSINALTDSQRWGVALAAAVAARCPSLTQAVREDAALLVDDRVFDAAATAAGIMAMTNIYYRAVHMAGDSDLAGLPAGLRMNALAKPAVDPVDFELFGLAASVVNGCEGCTKAHVSGARRHGATTEAIQTAIRIAAVLHAVATVLDDNQTTSPATSQATTMLQGMTGAPG